MTRKFWAGVAFVVIAAAIYMVRGLPASLDLIWHGGLLLLGLGLMLPDRYFLSAMETIRAVFGRQP